GNPDMDRATRASQALVRELLPWLPMDAVVMEFGCGLGLHSIALAPYCKRVVGIDISRRLLQLAKKLAREVDNVSFLWYDGGVLPFESETFDLVFSMGVFERIVKSRVQKYLADIRRILNANGRAFLYFLSNRAIGTEFTQRLGKQSYFYYTDTEAAVAVSNARMEVIEILKKPAAVIVVARRSR
ncbi:MAG: class I SAM-dependent methyltransferase, partial [Candidatus Binatia bacterium]